MLYSRFYNKKLDIDVIKADNYLIKNEPIIKVFSEKLDIELQPIREYINKNENEFIQIKIKTTRDPYNRNHYNNFDTIFIDENHIHILTNEGTTIYKDNVEDESDISPLYQLIEKIGIIPDSLSNPILAECRGNFILHSLTFQPIFLQDFILNNPIFNRFIFMDEHTRVYRERNNIFVYISMNYIDRTNINALYSMEEMTIGKAYIAPKFLSTGDKFLQSRDPKNLKIGNNYIEISLKDIKNIPSLLKCYNILTKLISYYIKEQNNTKRDYEMIIDNIKYIDVNKFYEKKDKLYHIDPSLFVPGYHRACQYPPSIVDDKINDKEREDNLKLIKKDEAVYDKEKKLLLYPTSDNSHYYSCPNNKFIGLKKNQLYNKNEYPYLPCCYDEDQFEKKRSFLNMFIQKIGINRRKSQGYLYTTMKQLQIKENV